MRVITQMKNEGDWYGFSNKGERIEGAFWDWCGMNILIQDIMDEQGLTEKLAEDEFWKEVRDFNPEEYDLILAKNGTLEDALGNGDMDELRNDFLVGIFIAEYEEEQED